MEHMFVDVDSCHWDNPNLPPHLPDIDEDLHPFPTDHNSSWDSVDAETPVTDISVPPYNTSSQLSNQQSINANMYPTLPQMIPGCYGAAPPYFDPMSAAMMPPPQPSIYHPPPPHPSHLNHSNMLYSRMVDNYMGHLSLSSVLADRAIKNQQVWSEQDEQTYTSNEELMNISSGLYQKIQPSLDRQPRQTQPIGNVGTIAPHQMNGRKQAITINHINGNQFTEKLNNITTDEPIPTTITAPITVPMTTVKNSVCDASDFASHMKPSTEDHDNNNSDSDKKDESDIDDTTPDDNFTATNLLHAFNNDSSPLRTHQKQENHPKRSASVDMSSQVSAQKNTSHNEQKRGSSVGAQSACSSNPDSEDGNARNRLPTHALDTLREWFQANIKYPYPKHFEKIRLTQESGLSMKQVNTWFTNTRKRVWQPCVDSLRRTDGDVNRQYELLNGNSDNANGNCGVRFTYNENIDPKLLNQLHSYQLFSEQPSEEQLLEETHKEDENKADPISNEEKETEVETSSTLPQLPPPPPPRSHSVSQVTDPSKSTPKLIHPVEVVPPVLPPPIPLVNPITIPIQPIPKQSHSTSDNTSIVAPTVATTDVPTSATVTTTVTTTATATTAPVALERKNTGRPPNTTHVGCRGTKRKHMPGALHHPHPSGVTPFLANGCSSAVPSSIIVQPPNLPPMQLSQPYLPHHLGPSTMYGCYPPNPYTDMNSYLGMNYDPYHPSMYASAAMPPPKPTQSKASGQKRSYEEAFMMQTYQNTVRNLAELYAIPDNIRPRPRRRQQIQSLSQPQQQLQCAASTVIADDDVVIIGTNVSESNHLRNQQQMTEIDTQRQTINEEPSELTDNNTDNQLSDINDVANIMNLHYYTH